MPNTAARPRRPVAKPGPRKADPASSATRQAVFRAAANAFAARGYDGVGVDEIARDAGVNKAMIYYHFADKLALYRAVLHDMLGEARQRLGAIAEAKDTPQKKICAFVEVFSALAGERPWLAALMLREIVEGTPRLDPATLDLMRGVFAAFGRIVAEGQKAGVFRHVNPVLAYMSALGPLIVNEARERVASVPGRDQLPMFVHIPRAEVVLHMQASILGMLAIEGREA